LATDAWIGTETNWAERKLLPRLKASKYGRQNPNATKGESLFKRTPPATEVRFGVEAATDPH